MKLSCHVARDLLPLYHDGVCSEESCVLVECHLESCQECAGILRELRREIEVICDAPDDGAILQKLGENVNREKKWAWMKGAAAVLAVALLLAAGMYGWWYTDTRAFYMRGAEGHEPHYGTNRYSWTGEHYNFDVTVPEYPGDGGNLYVSQNLKQYAVNITPGEEITTWLNIGREEYTYLVGMEVLTRTQIPDQPRLKTEVWTEYLMLDKTLNLVFADYMDEEDRSRQKRVFEDYFPEIMEIIEAAWNQWPFLRE